MKFELTKKSVEYFINRYNIKKRMIKKIENEVNMIGIVKTEKDFFELIEIIISTYSYIKIGKNNFSGDKDKLIINLTLEDLIDFALEKKYKLKFKKEIKEHTDNKLIDEFFYTKEENDYFEEQLKIK